MDTERYLTIHESNFTGFSIEFIKQYQAICSEIDVVSKAYCKELDSEFKGNKIANYCECITNNVDDFTKRIIILSRHRLEIKPWDGWCYEYKIKKKGKKYPFSNSLPWWKSYNNVKHNRAAKTEGRFNYEYANQKNVLYALAALFQLEMYYFRTLHKKYFSNDPDMPSESTLFEIKDWGNRFYVRDRLAFAIEG